MLSWESQYTLFQDLTSDPDATVLTLGKNLIHQGQSKLESELGTYYTEKSRTFATVTDAISGTSDQAYKLPENFKSLTTLYVTSGTNRYYAELVQDEEFWASLNRTTGQKSNYVMYCFIRQDRVELFPIPSSTLTATMWYEAFTRPLTAADYATGTITTLTNGASAVTASGSTFTSAMAGRYFRIDGDGDWYKIASFGTTTTLTLDTKYQGISIAAGSEAYTIGQMPITPPETHELPVYYAVWRWALMRKDTQLAREYERMWKEGLQEARASWGNRGSSNVTKGTLLRGRRILNPNWWPESMT